MLSPDDILNLFAGNITTCCQKFGDVGEGAMLLGSIEENAGIFVVEEKGEEGQTNIIGQSLVIRQKGKDGERDRLCFDNIEIVSNVLDNMSEEEHKQVLEIYKQAGEQAIQKDKQFLGKQLKQGEITQETYDKQVLKEVIAGTGYNDLKGLGDMPKAQIVVADESYYNYTTIDGNKINPWIDSAGGKAPKGSSGIPVIIATIDKEEERKIERRRKLGYDIIVPNQEVKMWYGKVGKVEKYDEKMPYKAIETIKEIERKAYREEQQILNSQEVQSKEDIENMYGIENIKAVIGSNKDWYLIYGEDEEQVKISDLAVIGGINAEKGKVEKGNIKLATAEATDTLYEILIRAGKEKKEIYCNATKDTSLLNIKRMLKKGIIKLKDEEGKVIIIPEVEKLEEEKEKMDMLLSKVRETIKMTGTPKETGIDELRRNIREDLEI